MGKEPQSIPAQAPPAASGVAEGLRAAAADPAARRGAFVRLHVFGGVHGEAYELDYRIDADGRESGQMKDDLKGRSDQTSAAKSKVVAPARFAAMLRAIDVDSLMRADPPRTGFPPDSVVGRLEISDGERTESFLFLANETQAVDARMATPSALSKAADVLFDAAADHFGTKEVRP